MDNYRFNSIGHLHEICIDGEWRPLTGVTTILQILAKPALIPWAVGMAIDYIKNNCQKDELMRYLVNLADLEEAKSAHRKKKEEAGQKGTDVHAIIEKEIKEAIEKNEGFISEFKFDREELPQVKHFIKWAVGNKVKFLESEKHIWSKNLWIAGICDFVCEIGGEIYLGDIKTGSGIYPEAFAQLSGYQLMFEEMDIYKNIKGHIIVNLKKDGTFQEKRSISLEDFKEFFLSCLKIYRVQEKIKGSIID